MDFIAEIQSFIPASPAMQIDWVSLERKMDGCFFSRMQETMQNPDYHGEGNVLIHTRMGCEELVKIPEFYRLSRPGQAELFLAAFLHDIGKIRTLRFRRKAAAAGNCLQPDPVPHAAPSYAGSGRFGAKSQRGGLCRGTVLLMSGLLGTGKDTWIGENVSELPMISLDEIWREKKVKPADAQGEVVQEAQERAKSYLRRRQPFVWNATDLTRDIRQKQISLFERYGASVRIIYLETDWETQMERNRSREAQVPQEAIERMLAKLVPLTPEEAKCVEWHCV